ncbi:MAG: hypothetical protein EOO63_10420 [Hymenobacter sp.]|nr:MAG: hypothetical protein EOO63_10420 [Hymenobacter sp.]
MRCLLLLGGLVLSGTRRGPQVMQLYGAAGNSQPVIERLANRVTKQMQQQCLPTLMWLKENK